MTGFAAGESTWRARLGTLRQVVRQELVARQLAAHLPDQPTRTVLDIGCGQGTQLLRLAARGHKVTGPDRSESMLSDFRAALPPHTQARMVVADVHDAVGIFGPDSFDVVLCHGVLMYFDNPAPIVADLAALVAEGGLVSLLVRNGDALAMRPGLRHDWPTAQRSFEDMAYDNRIGVPARADRTTDLTALLADHGLTVSSRYGVRVFTDQTADETMVPPDDELAALLACEERAGARDPYRQVAALTHLIAQRA